MLTAKQKRQIAKENNQGKMGSCIKVMQMIKNGIFKHQPLTVPKKFGIYHFPSSTISQWLSYRQSPYYQGTMSEYLSRIPRRFIKD